MTASDLDRLIRLEEYLGEEIQGPVQQRMIVTWKDPGEADDV